MCVAVGCVLGRKGEREREKKKNEQLRACN